MDIWIIQDGEKKGPIRDYEIRGRIRDGILTGDTPAWHEGLDSWKTLGGLPLFAGEFERRDAEPVPMAEPGSRQTPPPVPAQARLIRRFWARWFDLYLYAGVWWFAMWAAGRDIGATLANPWIILFLYVPWFALEAVLLQRFGTTPGKWLLGLRVVNDDGSLLGTPAAIRRCLRVMFLGIGFGWGVLSLICQLLSVFTTRRLGRPLWDHVGGHHLEAAPLHPLRLAAYVAGLFAALQLQMIVVAPHVMENMGRMFPEMREHFEKNPPWHLPENR
jgi:uncharacterized RDD family membrane protein YckC